MTYSGINLLNVKNINRSGILKLLNSKGVMSRKDIAIALDLTPAAVTQITSELISKGILEERGEVTGDSKVGRKKILIGINYQVGNVLTICIEVNETTISVTDLAGKILSQEKIPTKKNSKGETFLEEVSIEAKEMLKKNDFKNSSFLGVGVSIPGFVSRDKGISYHAYSIWKEPVAVKETLEKYLDIPVLVENNVKAFAEAELVYGIGKTEDNIFFVKWGAGVGSTIVINNNIYDNQKGVTSELGHIVVKNSGRKCWCGRSGCLETEVSIHALVEKVQESFSAEKMPVLFQKIDGKIDGINEDNVALWISEKDSAIKEILTSAVSLLARTVANAVTLLAPDRVIYFGDMFNFPDVSMKFLEEYKRCVPSCENSFISYSKLSGKINYIGALAIVFNEFISNQ